MNFLAHLYLSGDNSELMIGNFIADSVKGSSYNTYPEGIKRGILLHRAIDYYSDHHPVFQNSVVRLRPVYHKYAGVIVDIFYDHFLARNWSAYSSKPLQQYADEVHSIMMKNVVLMPQKSLMFLRYAMRTNRLASYATTKGIGEVLYGMSRRTTFRSNMEKAGEELLKFNKEFEEDFALFFRDIQQYVKEWLEANPLVAK